MPGEGQGSDTFLLLDKEPAFHSLTANPIQGGGASPPPARRLGLLRRYVMKYLIVEDFSGQAVPFIFPRRVDHVDMFEQLPYGKVLSAGYVELQPDGTFDCYGGNAELQLKADPQKDSALLKEAFRKRPDHH